MLHAQKVQLTRAIERDQQAIKVIQARLDDLNVAMTDEELGKSIGEIERLRGRIKSYQRAIEKG